MSDLSKRIKNLHSRSKNVGRDYLVLFAECAVAMHENWTPMAELISGANPKDSVVLRKLAGYVLSGWTLKRDPKHRTGLRFTKEAGADYNRNRVDTIKTLAEQGNVLQGKSVSELISKGKPDVKTVSVDDLAKAYVKSAHKKVDDGACSAEDALKAMRLAIKAFEAEVSAKQVGDTRFADAA